MIPQKRGYRLAAKVKKKKAQNDITNIEKATKAKI